MALKQKFMFVLRDTSLDDCVRVVVFLCMCVTYLSDLCLTTPPSHHRMLQC